jgi:hypothetical protein
LRKKLWIAVRIAVLCLGLLYIVVTLPLRLSDKSKLTPEHLSWGTPVEVLAICDLIEQSKVESFTGGRIVTRYEFTQRVQEAEKAWYARRCSWDLVLPAGKKLKIGLRVAKSPGFPSNEVECPPVITSSAGAEEVVGLGTKATWIWENKVSEKESGTGLLRVCTAGALVDVLSEDFQSPEAAKKASEEIARAVVRKVEV